MPASNNSFESNPVPRLKQIFGDPIVFINWPRGCKATNRKWKHLRADSMTAGYLSRLQHGNIGVALGDVSGGLCAIDIDESDFVLPFEQVNPWAANTLQTHGARGRVFWVRFAGEYPGSKYLKNDSGVRIGEFRSNGNQSIVWGIHPDTQQPYQRIKDIPVATVKFTDIRWPSGVIPPPLQSSRADEDMSVRAEDAVSALSLSLSTCVNPVNLVPCTSCTRTLSDVVRAVVESCLPSGAGQNNELIFRLARHVKFLPDVSRGDQDFAFSLWYEKAAALGFLRLDESKDDYAGKFWMAIASAKTPPEIFDKAVELARAKPMPAEASLFETPNGKLITSVCYQLHLLTPPGEWWYLPSRKGAEMAGVHWTRVAGYLATLVGNDVITQREQSTMAKATRYSWNGFPHGRLPVTTGFQSSSDVDSNAFNK